MNEWAYLDSPDWPYIGPSMTRLKDGRVMCPICFAYRTKAELAMELVDGVLTTWDVCKGQCAVEAGIEEVP